VRVDEVLVGKELHLPRTRRECPGSFAVQLFTIHQHLQQRPSAPLRSSPQFSATPCLSLRLGLRSCGPVARQALALQRVQRGCGVDGFADWGVDRDATPTKSCLFLDLAHRTPCPTRSESAPRPPVSALVRVPNSVQPDSERQAQPAPSPRRTRDNPTSARPTSAPDRSAPSADGSRGESPWCSRGSDGRCH